MQMYAIDKMTLKAQYVEAAHELFGKELNKLLPYELNAVINRVVMSKVVAPNWENSLNLFSEKRIAVYLSIEYLIGRVVLDALTNTGLMKVTRKIFSEEGVDINILEEVEDAALGNGGLGRLAACFVESAATKGYPLYGAGLFYKYGLFKQQFNGKGQQVEVPDDWTANEDAWFKRMDDDDIIVEFEDTKVKAVRYVVPVIGYNQSRTQFQGNVFPLTLWKAEPIEGVTNDSAAAISDWLYPNDKEDEGKKLRIRQEYFFCSAMMQFIFKQHLAKHGTLDNIEEYYIFQMNDTHPVFGCLEFIRLMQLNGYSFKDAFQKAKKCFAYTNHTIMSEALEKWSILLFKDMLPTLFKVVENLNQELIDELKVQDDFCFITMDDGVIHKQINWGLIREYELFANGVIHMSRIACYVSCKINGVAAVHTKIIQNDILAKWYKLYPWKFNNKTNGVTPRRWLKLANRPLANFLDGRLGKGWTTDLSRLEKLEQFKNDPQTLAEFAAIKHTAKITLADEIEKREGIRLDTNSIFDVQVKRIHEYKRQLMNAMSILYFYDEMKKGNLKDFPKTTFIIGGKAAASYGIAKQVISLIKDIQNMVNNDPEVNDRMQVIFLTNFNVSYAEKVYAGANFSEQISTAGTEASGTGNMKFMMNGAPTIGTMDGANIEIVEEAGNKNAYIFGATVGELKRIEPIYNHQSFLNANSDLVSLVDYLKGEREIKTKYWDLANILLLDDHYFIMYDLRSYIDARMRAFGDYAMEQKTGDLSYYTRKCLKNTAHSGKFSSDRTIQEYVDDIWHLERVNPFAD